MGSRRGMSKYMDQRVGSSFKVQITSLVDVFVILLVFLLKSYSTSPITINASKDISLPSSSSTVDPEDVLKLIVAQNGIFVEDKKIVSLEKGALGKDELDKNDPMYLPRLFKALDEQAAKTKTIAGVNDTVQFDGKVLMQADRNVPYELLKKVMYTSTMAGYSNLKIAVQAN